MSNEFITASDGPDVRDGFFRFSQGISYADRADEGSAPFSFAETGPPTENDLLPDDEPDSILRNKSLLSTYEYDVAVVGGGPAGYSAAVRASKLGAKTILFEKEMLGGPTAGSGAVMNLSNTLSQKHIPVNLTANVARLLRSNRIRVEAGEASLKNEHEIICRGKIYSVSKVILCGGTVAEKPKIQGASHSCVWTTGDIYKVTEVPPRLMVFGGGIEGCEIASAFSAAGSSVMLVEPEQRLLSCMDAKLAEAVHGALAKTGVKVYTGVSVTEIVDRDGYPFVITDRGGVLCDKFLAVAKRKPDVSSFGSFDSDIAVGDDAIVVNEFLETNIEGIYAAGECTGLSYQSHGAQRMGETAAENAMGKQKALDLSAIPVTVCTKPGAASVGISEEEAIEKFGDDLVIGNSMLAENVRAILSGQTEGFVKVLAGKKHGDIYGVHIFGAEAAEMIAEPAALMRMEITIHEVCGDIIHAYPTYAEAFAAACADALGKGASE